MKLSQFITDLLENGNVTIAGGLNEFEAKDKEETTTILQKHYHRSILEMPFEAPEFHKAAALWGAIFIYRTVQFIFLRDLDEEEIKTHLQDFQHLSASGVEEQINAEVVYSVDLTFRYLKDLLDLAKGLSPNDPLVIRLKGVAAQWAFSSVGISSLENINDKMFLENDSLKTTYIDRIIKAKDLKRIHNENIKELVATALGNHAQFFWKEFAKQTNVITKQ